MCTSKGVPLETPKAIRKFWTDKLHSSADGMSPAGAKNAPGSSKWLTEGTRFLKGREFIELVRIRINALPCLSRTKRGQNVPKTCRAGCTQLESLGHILQKCHRTHHERIRGHDTITRQIAKRLRELGFEVQEEPHFKTPQGERIPDLVVKRDTQSAILDVQVVGTRAPLSQVHLAKTMKYMDKSILDKVGGRPLVSSITITYRGIWARESVQTLRDLGFTANDFKVITIRCLQGGIGAFAVHRHITTTLSG